MSTSIRFLLGSQLQQLTGFDPQTTVLNWLRSHARRTGTKEGCAEGDCGACTVAVGELHQGRVRYRALNSCIQLLPTLNGKQLVTVEDLASVGEGLHPVQQAMVEQHGSQCGFCTPGFVMSLFCLFHQHPPDRPLERGAIDEAIAGNLCRCTGYAAIARAASQAIQYAPEDAFSRDERTIAARLQELQSEAMLRLEYRGRRYFAPQSLAQLWPLLKACPEALLCAGATDAGLQITKQLRVFDTIINLGDVRELKQIGCDGAGQQLRIGAAVSYSDAMETLTGCYPGMRPMLARLGAVQVRNAGTIGGNIANGSPIGDMPPALIVLGARLVLSSAGGRRELPLEAYFLAYGKQDLDPGECIETIVIPLRQPGQRFAVYKISKRFDQDISAVCGAFSLRLQHQRVADVRICFGGMAGTPRRATAVERALVGQLWSLETVQQAKLAMGLDYTPITDWRAGSEYRLRVAQNLLQRFYLETTSGEPAQLAAGPQP